ncbi:SseB family protein [Saccharopolyspora erythraea]|uniref:SseB family protein n=1 Tax=Saccharopolyspora erythraea TaxID=1836 RepID=UPI001BA9D581|nr:SseB family protein [Saccharopolyspora erythraea]QUH00634.1 SseB family protein [Saccharopolyspora erythraea]
MGTVTVPAPGNDVALSRPSACLGLVRFRPVTRASGGEEPDVVVVAREVSAGQRQLRAFHAAFAQAVVFAQRPERPGVFVTDAGRRGRWTPAFSTLDRLAAHAGECDYVSMTGADFLELVPAGVGVMFDPADDHRMPLLTRVEGMDVLEREWKKTAWKRAAQRSSGDEQRTRQGRGSR